MDGKRELLIQCGRNFGKTFAILYVCWRRAILYPGSIIYILAPERKWGKEIYWAPGRLQNFGPHQFLLPNLKGIKETEMRLKFRNGSFIAVDGADNPKAARGVKPDIVCLDEYQDHQEDLEEHLRPNLGAKRCIFMRVGTPPDRECNYTRVRDEFLREIARKNPDYYYLERPTASNPLFDKTFLKTEEKRLRERGEYAVFEREYLAKYVPGGASSVFPMLTKEKHRLPGNVIQARLKTSNRIEYYTVFDPGSTSCFAVGFFAYDRWNGFAYLLGEIYERDRFETSTRQIWSRAARLERELYLRPSRDGIRRVADEAAAWFINEMAQPDIGVGVDPTHKARRAKWENISLVKDALHAGRFIISDDCPNAWKEMHEYHVSEKGDIVKKDDHLVDCIQYFFDACGFVPGAVDPKAPKPERRFSTPETDFNDMGKSEIGWVPREVKFDDDDSDSDISDIWSL